MSKGSIEQLMLQRGLLQQEQLDEALAIQQERGGRLGDILISTGALTESDFQRFLADLYQLRYYSADELLSLKISEAVIDRIPYKIAMNYLVLPIGYKSQKNLLKVVALAPLPKKQQQQIIEKTNVDNLIYCLGTRDGLKASIRHHYKSSSNSINTTSTNAFSEELEIKDPLLGEILNGKWRLKKQLGQGAMGLVYLGEHIEQKHRAAVKLLQTNFKIDDEALQRFYREARIMRRLKHPNIIRIYEFGFQEKLGFYLVMEFLTGCTLEEFLEEHPVLTLDEVSKLISQVCSAMDHAHQQNIIHRDLKPDNIYITGGPHELGEAKILDFGIARMQEDGLSRVTQHGATLGTPQYLSPEQAMAGELDHRTDLYSLSVILFEVLTNRPLFEADSPYQYLMRHVYTPPQSLAEARPDLKYPRKLNDLIQDGLSKKKEDRPSSMKEFRDRLLKALKIKTKVQAPSVDEEVSDVEKQQAAVGSYHMSVRSRGDGEKKDISKPVDSLIRSPQIRERGQKGPARAIRGDFLAREKRMGWMKRSAIILLLLGGISWGYFQFFSKKGLTPEERTKAQQDWTGLQLASLNIPKKRKIKKRKRRYRKRKRWKRHRRKRRNRRKRKR